MITDLIFLLVGNMIAVSIPKFRNCAAVAVLATEPVKEDRRRSSIAVHAIVFDSVIHLENIHLNHRDEVVACRCISFSLKSSLVKSHPDCFSCSTNLHSGTRHLISAPKLCLSG